MSMLSTLANGVISVAALFMCLAVALAFVWRRPDRRGPRLWLTGVLVVYGVLAIPIVPYAASLVFGRHYSPLTAEATDPSIRAIVVLGAGTQIIAGPEQQLALLDGNGASRVLEGARLFHRLDQPWVISSGGTRRRNPNLSSAVAMKTALTELGVAPSRILLETRSLTTRDEAVLIAPMLRELKVDRFLLVTHRAHMPRSMAAFEQQALAPVPAIVPDGLEDASWRDLLTPGIEGLRLSQALLHEMIGLVYYRWQGWIRA
jgi:uncharacterized SAM-binding protein YcdF (DUF218 family)